MNLTLRTIVALAVFLGACERSAPRHASTDEDESKRAPVGPERKHQHQREGVRFHPLTVVSPERFEPSAWSLRETVRAPQQPLEDCWAQGTHETAEELARFSATPRDNVAIYDGHVYYPHGNDIMSYDLASGRAKTTVEGQLGPTALWAGEAGLLWMNRSVAVWAEDRDADGTTISIMYHNDGRGTRPLYESVVSATALTVHRGHVYWVDRRARLLLSVSLGGGDAHAVAGWTPSIIAGRTFDRTDTVGLDAEGDRIYWAVAESAEHEGHPVHVERVMSADWIGKDARLEQAFRTGQLDRGRALRVAHGKLALAMLGREHRGIALAPVGGGTVHLHSAPEMMVTALTSEGEWIYAAGHELRPDHDATSILAYSWAGEQACKVHTAGRLVEDIRVHNGYLVWMEYAGAPPLEYRIVGLRLPSIPAKPGGPALAPAPG